MDPRAVPVSRERERMMPECTFLPSIALRSRGRGLLMVVLLVATALVSDRGIERVERIAPDGCGIVRIIN
jgi:hypothetical protein